jgi:PAS domain S-box-containing protein
MAPGFRATLRSVRLAWLVLLVGAAVSVALGTWVRRDVRRHAERVGERRVSQLRAEIQTRLDSYHALLGEAGTVVTVHAGSAGKAPEELLRPLGTREGVPEFSALGLCLLEGKAEGAARCVTVAVVSQKAEGWHVPGLDHLSIPERAEAMGRARDTGQVALTAPLRLMVDAPTGRPSSVILYAPVYRGAGVPTGLEARRAAIRGYVFCAIPATALAGGTWHLQVRDSVVDILDEATGTVLYRSSGWELTAPESAGEATAPLEVGGRTWRIAMRPLDATGTDRDARDPWHVLLLGLLVSVLGFAVAVSLEGARARAEGLARDMAREAWENEARLREIAETMGEGLYVVDQDGCVTFANAEAGRLLGWDPRDLLGKDAHDLFHRQTAEGEQISAGTCGILRVARQGGRYVSEEETYWHREHRPLAVAVSASPVLRAGSPHGAVVVFRDISGRKQAEANLEERSAWVRAMLDTPSFRIWIKDRDGRYMAVNTPFAEGCGGGRAPESILGLTDFDLLPREVAEAHATVDREVMTSRQPRTLEQATEGPEGRRWTETVKTPILGRDGEVYGVAGLSRDITDRKQVEWALGHAQKLESLELMAGGIAHDFNNLFQGLLGNLELARMDVSEDSRAGICLQRMGEILARAARLSGEMLLYSGRSHLRHEPLDLRLLASQAAGGRAQLDLDGDLPSLEGDPVQIGKLLAILVENAAEAGGSEAARLSLRRVDLGAGDLAEGYWPEPGRPGPVVRIEVVDRGPGVPPEVMRRMFDPFYSTKAMGRGLGLPAALGILRGHQGRIQVISRPGQGTRVRVYFPVRESSRPAAGSELVPLAKGTLLIVDDDEEVRRPIAELIRSRLGYEVLEASGGEEAVALFRAQADRIALVLMDATMPGLDGSAAFEAMRRIRPDARAILCSGYGDETGRAAAAEHGFAAFLRKPFSLKELESLLVQHLAGR